MFVLICFVFHIPPKFLVFYLFSWLIFETSFISIFTPVKLDTSEQNGNVEQVFKDYLNKVWTYLITTYLFHSLRFGFRGEHNQLFIQALKNLLLQRRRCWLRRRPELSITHHPVLFKVLLWVYLTKPLPLSDRLCNVTYAFKSSPDIWNTTGLLPVLCRYIYHCFSG